MDGGSGAEDECVRVEKVGDWADLLVCEPCAVVETAVKVGVARSVEPVDSVHGPVRERCEVDRPACTVRCCENGLPSPCGVVCALGMDDRGNLYSVAPANAVAVVHVPYPCLVVTVKSDDRVNPLRRRVSRLDDPFGLPDDWRAQCSRSEEERAVAAVGEEAGLVESSVEGVC